MGSEEDNTIEEGINWIQPNSSHVWLWKSILFPLTIPVLAHFNCTILLHLKETDSKSNPVREESSMAFGAHKAHILSSSQRLVKVIYFSKTAAMPHDSWVLSASWQCVLLLPFQRSSPLSPASYDLILSASKSQGKLWRLTAWASCWDLNCLFVSPGPEGVAFGRMRRKLLPGVQQCPGLSLFWLWKELGF